MKKILLPLLVLCLLSTFLSGCTKAEPATSEASVSEPSSSEASVSEISSSSPSQGVSEAASSDSAQPSEAPAKFPTNKTSAIAWNDAINPQKLQLLQLETPAADAPTVVFKTTLGELTAVLYPTEAPKAVENFLSLVEKGFYTGKSFYTLMPGERIFAGATDAYGYEGESASGTPFADEYSLKLWHFNGALCMNNQLLSKNNDSRFYIVQNEKLPEGLAGEMADAAFPQKIIDQYLKTGGLPGADHRDTVFGQITAGLDVVKAIAEASAQQQPVKIESVTVSKSAGN